MKGLPPEQCSHLETNSGAQFFRIARQPESTITAPVTEPSMSSQKKTGHLSTAGASFTRLSMCLLASTLSAADAAAIGSGLGLVDLDLA